MTRGVFDPFDGECKYMQNSTKQLKTVDNVWCMWYNLDDLKFVFWEVVAMMKTKTKFRNIEILEKASNKKGDLFGRLMADFFHSVGFGEPRLNIHKSGREIDIEAYHRHEKKIAIAECKAEQKKIGGGEVNKFRGAFVVEKEKREDREGIDAVGYYVSLSGFTETEKEQESEAGGSSVILIDSQTIVNELINGRILVSIEQAMVDLAPLLMAEMKILENVDLCACENGWIWVFYFSNSDGISPTHCAFVHADGKSLVGKLAKELHGFEKFKNLNLLNKEHTPEEAIEKKIKKAKESYFDYLKNELGHIQFDGMPTDNEKGVVKVNLENIFVPLRFDEMHEKSHFEEMHGKGNEAKNQDIGQLLEKNKVAILSSPGGGKSTLMKRLAVAYAFPERRKQIADKLPDRDWLPIFIRCRDLGEMVGLSITEIIAKIPARAEILEQKDGFFALTSRALQDGKALLLIDGLDEIADDNKRMTFTNQLITFIAKYPNIKLVVTSRVAGFRVVSSSLSAYCKQFSISDLSPTEIGELCSKWHSVVVDNKEETKKESEKLCEDIVKDGKIYALAKNPLMLTVLLFVKKQSGYLPTQKSRLYQEMIKLLLISWNWNIDGLQRIDIDEAESQLAFVAYWMTKNEKQTITAKELKECLTEARKDMPHVLAYTKISPKEFIDRVEQRSGLLMMSGRERDEKDGSITPIYQFMHLSFQEYLTAKAIAEEYLPKCDSHLKPVEIVERNYEDKNWEEVIPLLAVLLKGKAEEIVEFLIKADEQSEKKNLIAKLVGNCLANEIQISPELLKKSIGIFVKMKFGQDMENLTEIVSKSKFGEEFREVGERLFFENYSSKAFSSLSYVVEKTFVFNCEEQKKDLIKEIVLNLNSSDKRNQVKAILASVSVAIGNSFKKTKKKFFEKDVFKKLLEFFSLNDPLYNSVTCWLLYMTELNLCLPESYRNDFLKILIKRWTEEEENSFIRAHFRVALKNILLPTVSQDVIFDLEKVKNKCMEVIKDSINSYEHGVAILLGTVCGLEFNKKEIIEIFAMLESFDDSYYNIGLFAKHLNIDMNLVKEKRQN